MSGVQPVAVYALKVPAGGAMVPAVPNAAAMVRLIRTLQVALAVRTNVVSVVPREHGCR